MIKTFEVNDVFCRASPNSSVPLSVPIHVLRVDRRDNVIDLWWEGLVNEANGQAFNLKEMEERLNAGIYIYCEPDLL